MESWSREHGGSESSDNLRSEDTELPTEDGKVSTDNELPDVKVVLSDRVELRIDAASLSSSSAAPEQNSRNWGCWLHTARNVSLQVKMSQIS